MDLSHKLPEYQTEKRNIVRLIIFTAAFALIFINIYSPFELTSWITNEAPAWLKIGNLDLLLLIYSSFIILTGVLVVVISRIIMYQVTKRRGRITIAQFLVWIAVEIISMAMFYALYEKLFLNDTRSFVDAYKASIQNTALVLLFPYSILWLYFSWIDKNKQLQKLTDSGEMAFDSMDMVTFRDEKGTMRLSIKLADLLFLQASDNYVTIFYDHQEKQAKYLLRSSLKIIQEELKHLPLIRCHRSYMVNFEKVKIIRREKDGLKLELETPVPTEIPVSKTYVEEVFKAFGENIH
ncbi:MAG: LytTR family transcriptional regulator DNA-binding domain-containing protein [Bacteroidales bacterium]|nr:LytTR family transcriptional regulator DNA-binding domain-containing protein [Bacteroidales bacterium]